MKKEIPFYPPLVALFPTLSVYSANLAYVPFSHLPRVLGTVLGATLLLWLFLGLVLRNAARGAAAAAVFTLCFFGFSWFVGVLPFAPDDNAPLAIWGSVCAVLMGLAAWKATWVRPLNVLSTFLVLMALGQVGLGHYRAARLNANHARADTSGKGGTDSRPDIFYIVLDGYGRSDALKSALGFSNDPFIAGLRQRGFFVADGSHANYCQTELSLASSLNMEFIPKLVPDAKPEMSDRGPLAARIDDNQLARTLRAKGYRFVSVTTGFPPVLFTKADLRLQDRSGRTMIESALLQMTPLATSKGAVESMYDQRRVGLLAAFDNLASLTEPTPSTRLVVAHILAPHPPFVFGPNGENRRYKGPYGFWDASDYLMYVGSKADYRRGYSEQAEFIGKKVLETIDQLIKDGRKPVIVIQGDHGSKVGLDQNSLEKTDIHECFPILNAYLVPDSVRKDLRPDITPVNTFRVLLRNLFGDDLKPLPDRSYYSGYATPYNFTDVTARLGAKPRPAP
jgi:hypothetical protein